MLWVIIGIVVLAVASLIIAGHEHIQKKKDDATKTPDGSQNTICTRKFDGLQNIKEHEDHLND